jgi:hypothetical protein
MTTPSDCGSTSIKSQNDRPRSKHLLAQQVRYQFVNLFHLCFKVGADEGTLFRNLSYRDYDFD